MGRYGYGSGAFAVRAKAKKKRRGSVANDVVYTNYEKFSTIQKFLQMHKNSKDSGRNVPDKIEEESGTPDEETLIPGQIPSTLSEKKEDNFKSLVAPSEAMMPGPSWWPGPPLQQGGVVRPPPQLAPNGTVSSGIPQVPNLFSGFSNGPWLEIQAKLMPEAEKALKFGHQFFYDNEVGS
ncbi:uncharacterized protein LOC135217926 [Macrobrachium nipponense]|uniref:uncharacterized protein LOC135217926 n=1 Tax=Macrobrachium nipponense TaxID=159736 RepID=UPI0030C88685